jgi:hypothetical protein
MQLQTILKTRVFFGEKKHNLRKKQSVHIEWTKHKFFDL